VEHFTRQFDTTLCYSAPLHMFPLINRTYKEHDSRGSGTTHLSPYEKTQHKHTFRPHLLAALISRWASFKNGRAGKSLGVDVFLPP